MSQGDSWDMPEKSNAMETDKPAVPSLQVEFTSRKRSGSKPRPRTDSIGEEPSDDQTARTNMAVTPRRNSSPRSPMSVLKKMLAPKEEKKADINFEVYGRLCAMSYPSLTEFTAEDMEIFGKADYLERPHDKVQLLQVAASKGTLEFFKSCEVKFPDLLDDDFIRELASIAQANNKEEIAGYLKAKLPPTVKVVL